ncbi:unnamed protein product [Polarella glacialis]|uniref:Uncharacterized protein n=1 Tax=Polarella glacialis TaxID=89957 RepID=A0A813K2K6_POLGL|nr:unnamed protein product [Polarella glacialis]
MPKQHLSRQPQVAQLSQSHSARQLQVANYKSHNYKSRKIHTRSLLLPHDVAWYDLLKNWMQIHLHHLPNNNTNSNNNNSNNNNTNNTNNNNDNSNNNNNDDNNNNNTPCKLLTAHHLHLL